MKNSSLSNTHKHRLLIISDDDKSLHLLSERSCRLPFVTEGRVAAPVVSDIVVVSVDAIVASFFSSLPTVSTRTIITPTTIVAHKIHHSFLRRRCSHLEAKEALLTGGRSRRHRHTKHCVDQMAPVMRSSHLI